MSEPSKREAFLNALPGSSLSIAEITKLVGIDLSYGYRIIREEAQKLGMSPVQFRMSISPSFIPSSIHRADISASTQLFKESFFQNKQKGISIRDMAKSYGICVSTAYSIIMEISIEKGIPYESLLYYPDRGNHSSNSKIIRNQEIREDIMEKFQDTLNDISEIRKSIANFIQ